jgi:hypothetical protein
MSKDKRKHIGEIFNKYWSILSKAEKQTLFTKKVEDVVDYISHYELLKSNYSEENLY